MLTAQNLRTRSILCGPRGELYLVVSRALHRETRETIGVEVEPLDGGERERFSLDKLQPVSGKVTSLPRDQTTLERFLHLSVMERRHAAFREFVNRSYEIPCIQSALGITYRSADLFRALEAWNRGMRIARTPAARRRVIARERTDPHYPGKPRRYCVACGKKVRIFRGDTFPIHAACRGEGKDSGQIRERYCSYCGEKYTLSEFRERFPAVKSIARQMACPDGEEIRSSAREMR